MIKASRFLLLAFSTRDFAPDEHVQKYATRTGAEMTIFERIDTERHRRDINLCKPVSQPDATGFSGVSPDQIEARPSAFFADYSEEHSTPGKPEPIAKSISRIGAQKPAISKDHEV